MGDYGGEGFLKQGSRKMGLNQMHCIEILVKILMGFSEKNHMLNIIFRTSTEDNFESKYKYLDYKCILI